MKRLLFCCLISLASGTLADEARPPLKPFDAQSSDFAPIEDTITLKALDAATVVDWFDTKAAPNSWGSAAPGCGKPDFSTLPSAASPYGNSAPYGYTANPYILNAYGAANNYPPPYGIESLTAVDGNTLRIKAPRQKINYVRALIEDVDKPGTIIFEAVGYKIEKVEIENNRLRAPEFWPSDGELRPEQIRCQIDTFEALTRNRKARQSHEMQPRAELSPRVARSGQQACFSLTEIILLRNPALDNPNAVIVGPLVPLELTRGLQMTAIVNEDGALKVDTVPFHKSGPTTWNPTPGTVIQDEGKRTLIVNGEEPLLIELTAAPGGIRDDRFRYYLAVTARVAHEKK
jgi:hypothetical protein